MKPSRVISCLEVMENGMSIFTRLVGKFGLVWFYGILTVVGYSMPNPVYTHIFNIYNM